MLIVVLSFVIMAVNRRIPISSVEFWAVKLGILYILVPLIVLYVLKKNPKDYGLNLRNYKKSLRYFFFILLVSLPIMAYGSQIDEFQRYYPLFSDDSPFSFVKNELFIGVVMLSTEFFFRGFLMFELRKKIGWYAIIVQTIPYGFLHMGKPMIEVYYSFGAGIVLGYMNYKTKSILPSFLSHYIPSIIFDILCL
ncbi:MAG: type II CAAX endopeptidase family protein [Euryarchaeota archaeon]|nr:type II CAAX endopeptidase family protein [Euryarchaeota archaeon]